MSNNNQLFKNSIDDLVFENRNKSYGAYWLRRLYPNNMTKGMISGTLLFLLMVLSPKIMDAIKRLAPEEDELIMKEVTLAEPPPIDPKKPPPPPPPKVDPPPIKDQIRFVPPKVMKDEEVIEEEPPPKVEDIKDKEIADETKKGEEDGVDASLAEPEAPPPPPPVIEEEKPEEPLLVVQQMPEYPDGTAAMYKYIMSNFNYPAIARENGLEGTVTAEFIVSKDGDISQVKVLRGIGGGCDEEVIRVLKTMPRWKPGKNNGKAVPVRFRLPVKLKLQ